ncbi:MAG: hypothetical protein H0U74_12605 [Bradymonadaceae bacterium]|nr:hypothetical protein [Lujinxingiaceae bacterium]
MDLEVVTLDYDMHSNDGKNSLPPWQQPQSLEETTDPNEDRVATQIIVDDEATPPPGYGPSYRTEPSFAGQARAQAPMTGRHPVPQFTPAPGPHTGPFVAPQFTPPQFTPAPGPSTGAFVAPQFTPPAGSNTGFIPIAQLTGGAGFASQRSPAEIEDFSNTGFIPAAMFKAPVVLRVELSVEERIKYALVAATGGALIGAIMGILNAKLQGWTINQGMPQLLMLLGLIAVVFGAIAYARPERVEELLAKAGLSQDDPLPLPSPQPGQHPSNVYSQQPGPQGRPPQGFASHDPDDTDEFAQR